MNYKNVALYTGILLGAAILILGYGGYRYHLLGQLFQQTKTDLGNNITELQNNVARLEYEKTSLNDALESEREKNAEFEEQIEDIAGTVGVLDKLSKTDPELLKKYSKVYFLNEHYVPEELTNIDEKFLFDEDKPILFHDNAAPFLKKLLNDSVKARLELKVASGFRSFDNQSTLKTGYSVVYGAGTANQFSADQGYSEHQLGTAVDFTAPGVSPTLDGFEITPEYKWLVNNAYKYGFVLSYPPGNAYYQYEPWHWRFVGIKLAKKLHSDDEYFYDIDQRTIDSYLINLFDNN